MPALRIPSLDGLRAISIALVLMLHVSDTRHFLSTERVSLINPGDLGVRTFFVISGFLITFLLLGELESTGRISLKDFYIRRVFRIFPAFYAYVAVLVGLSFAGVIALGPGDLAHALTYTVNYHVQGRSWYVSHLWSLSVEEQFYLLWPATLAFLGRRRGFLAAAAVMVVVPPLRVLLWQFVPSYHRLILQSFETVCDALATGCLLAGLRPWLWEQEWYRRILRSRWFVLAPFVVLGCDMLYIKPRLYFFFFIPLMNVTLALIIDWCVRNSTGRIGVFLNWGPVAFVGVLSYSLYLWQQLYCQEYRHPATWWGAFPMNVTLALATAVASYFAIEQPCLRLRKYFSRSGKAARAAVTTT